MAPSAGELRATPLFRDFDEVALAALAALFTRVTVDATAPLFDVGEPAHTFYLLTAGEVVLERPDDDVFRLVPPALIGELGALATLPRSTRATVTPGSIVWGLSAQTLQAYFADHQDRGVQFLANLLGAVADKVHRDQRRMAGMRQNLMRTQKELKRLRDLVLESVETPVSAAVHDSLDKLIAHNRRVNYHIEPPPLLPAEAKLDGRTAGSAAEGQGGVVDGRGLPPAGSPAEWQGGVVDALAGTIVRISRTDLTLRVARPLPALDRWCSGVLELAGTQIPISGTVSRVSDDRVTVTFDLLIEEYAAVLESYLTRAQLLDVLV